jgi:hypothetical protein
MVRKSHWCAGITETRGSLANSYWGMAFPRSVYARVKVFQRVNHFPGTFELGRKDRLLRGEYTDSLLQALIHCYMH